MANVGDIPQLKADLKEVMDELFNNVDPNQDPDAAREEFAERFSQAMSDWAESIVVKNDFDSPISDVVSNLVPVPQDGGAAIASQMTSKAGVYADKSTGNLE